MRQQVRARFRRTRHRFGWFDHVIRAGVRYDHADGGRLAAAVTYYAFFAVLASALLAFAILGFVLDNGTVLRAVENYLSANLPRLDVQALRNARSTVGIVAFVVLPVAGLFWVDALRSSIRAIWHLEQYPGRFFLRQAIDLGILAGLGILLAVSLTVSGGARAILHWLVIDAGNADGSIGRLLLDVAAFVLGIGVNTVLATAILTALPRLRMRARRVYAPAVLIAVGLEILNTIGRLYVQRTEANPAYQVVTGAVGLLVSLSLLNQLILFAAALTATGTAEPVTDYAGRPRRVTAPDDSPHPGAPRHDEPATAQPVTLRRTRRRNAGRRPPGRPPC